MCGEEEGGCVTLAVPPWLKRRRGWVLSKDGGRCAHCEDEKATQSYALASREVWRGREREKSKKKKQETGVMVSLRDERQ